MTAKIKESTPNKVVLEFTAEAMQTTVCLTRDEFIEFTQSINKVYFDLIKV